MRSNIWPMEKWTEKPLPTFPQALRLLLVEMSSQKGDISTLEKWGHFYFGLTVMKYLIENVNDVSELDVSTRLSTANGVGFHQSGDLKNLLISD